MKLYYSLRTSTMNALIKLIACSIKFLNPPHIIKYIFFVVFIKNKRIKLTSKIKVSGAKINLELGNFIDYWIFMDGAYEYKWVKYIKKIVKNKVFVDIGAYIGDYSLSLYKTAKLVYAFEPEKRNYQRLLQNIKLNNASNIIPVNLALADKKGCSIIYVNKNDLGWSSLKMHHKDSKEIINQITFDSFLQKNKIENMGLIKIDVEGSEMDVLKGLVKTIRKTNIPILIEFNEVFSRLSGYNVNDIYEFMKKFRYKAFYIEGEKLIPFHISKMKKDFNDNILFVK